MIKFSLDRRQQRPLYYQMYDQLRRAILAGELPAEAQLPPERILAQEYQLSRVTVAAAYDQLFREGYVQKQPGAGTFVAPISAPITQSQSSFTPQLSAWGKRLLAPTKSAVARPAPRLDIDFGFGRSFTHTFPYHIWRRLLARYLSTDDAMLSRYGSPAGFEPLRQAVAAYLVRGRGVKCDPAQVVIVSGIQQALDLLARLFLQAGDEVLIEEPGYSEASRLFQAHGAQLTAVAVDNYGLQVSAIPPACKARLAFITPSNQFPHGGALPLARRLALLAWAARRDCLLIEDDYDGQLRYEGRPLAALQGLDSEGRVIYVGAFSKVLFPALRLGYVVLPPALLEPFLQAKRLTDRGAPTLTQAAVADFIQEGHFERHLRHLQRTYGRRRAALAEALTSYLPDLGHYAPEPAGLHILLHLPPHIDELQLVRDAAAVGVGVYPGTPHFQQQPAPPAILLGFSGLSEPEIEEGIKRLATVLG